MSLLAPLYLLGLAAVSLPILFHLIRRTPRGRQQFSSLMFLTPSPPRLTRRSRIDNWLLLLLRAAALILLALAFMRPFLRQVANLSFDGVRGRRVAILLDTSASMRRDGMWQQAGDKIDKLLSELAAVDEVALYSFDRDVQSVVPFSDQAKTRRANRRELVREATRELQPTWYHSDLGSALVTIAEELTLAGDDPSANAVSQVVVVTDLQQGVDLRAIQQYEWPKEVLVAIEAIEPTDPSNATLALLQMEEEIEAGDHVRVRVANAEDSTVEQFQVRWADSTAANDSLATPSDATPIYVPAGQSRVVRMPKPAAQLTDDEPIRDRLLITGESAEFDNTFFVVPQHQDQVELLYVGSDKEDDPSSLHYYLRLALGETVRRKVDLICEQPTESIAALSSNTRMVVVSSDLSDASMKQVNEYIEGGGTVLFVPTSPKASTRLAKEFDYLEYVETKSGSRDDYLMLVDIDFAHPVFKPFATARYSDFTKIHFWRYQRFQLASEHKAHVMTWFDNGDPAMWQQRHGKGSLYVWAAGWHPDDSQIALSTKFVPLLNTMLDQATGTPVHMPSYVVGESVPVAADDVAVTVAKPDGVQTQIEAGESWFRDTDQPGIYQIHSSGTPVQFAVNLSARESDTARLDVEQLSELGVQLGEHRTQAEESDRQRQLRDVELESQQQLWRWLIVTVLGILGMETWLAGRKPTAQVAREGEAG